MGLKKKVKKVGKKVVEAAKVVVPVLTAIGELGALSGESDDQQSPR